MSQVDRAIAQLEKAGFVLIFASRPEKSPETDEWGRPFRSRTLEVRLDLEDLLKFPTNALPVVFYDRHTFWEDELKHSEFRHEDTSSMEVVEIDLLPLEPRLKRFQRHMNEASEVNFFAPYNGLMMVCHVREDWYTEFLGLRQPALTQVWEQLAGEVQAQREAQAAQEQERLRPHEQRIRLLFDDTGFLKLARVKNTAQRTLLHYAKQREPQAVAALGEQRTKDLLLEIRDSLLAGQTR